MKFSDPFINLLKMLWCFFVTGILINSNNQKIEKYLEDIESGIVKCKEITIFKERV